MSGSLGLVVPLYDEEPRFAEYAKFLVDFIADQPTGSELVFVDDGSRDGTVGLVERLLAAHPDQPVTLLRRPHQGKGAAVAAGLRALRTDYAGFCDLDLSTPLDQLERVVQAAARAPVLAIGSRDLATSKLVQPEGRAREALGRAYNRLLQATITPGVVDTQCGAKVAARELWRAILPHCHEGGYAWDAEAIAVARALGIEVQEVPIEWHHDERSKVRVVRDGAQMVWATRRIRHRARVAATAARAGDGEEVFDGLNAELLMEADSTHWWFRSKAALVSTALRRTDPGLDGRGPLVDVGAGSGGVTAMLGWEPRNVVVVEGNHALVSRARGRHGLAALRAGADGLPLADGTASVVCLLDVIEHLADPRPTLREAARVLAPGGRLVVNVPAHRWLWSAADELLGHVRRYDRPSLRRELSAAGFRTMILTHVFSWLVAPVLLTRRVAERDRPQLGLDRSTRLIDVAALVLTWAERTLVGRLSLPFGTSVLAVAERRTDREADRSGAGSLG